MSDVTQPVAEDGETIRQGDKETPELLLWLPGYHTPSLNVTAGKHWSVYRRHKQKAAGEVLMALVGSSPVFALARRILLLLSHGGTKAEVQKLRAPALPAEVTGLARLTYTRVTCRPLDDENHEGSTKGLTDCLVSALPGWLPDDSTEHVEILHNQQRCGHRHEEGTWIELKLGLNDE